MDALLLPSLFEGLPVVLVVEAQTLDCPALGRHTVDKWVPRLPTAYIFTAAGLKPPGRSPHRRGSLRDLTPAAGRGGRA